MCVIDVMSTSNESMKTVTSLVISPNLNFDSLPRTFRSTPLAPKVYKDLTPLTQGSEGKPIATEVSKVVWSCDESN